MKRCMTFKFNPRNPWEDIADMQEKERLYDQAQKAKEQQDKAAAQYSGGFSAGVKHRLSPGELWRATDFWREGLLKNIRDDIKIYNKDTKTDNKEFAKSKISKDNYNKIENAKKAKTLPADFFVDVKGWLWSVKEDGYLVKLIRNEENNKWSIFTRKGKLLHPPSDFLQGLEQNKELPSLMIGELVTNFTGCDIHHRTDIHKRNIKRNDQFSRLNRVLHDTQGNKDVWDGLRVKIFSFPHSSMIIDDKHSTRRIKKTYDHYSQVMQKTLEYHRHIGMCKFGTLASTQHAIDIFNMVVQLGLEGIVIVDPNVQYGALTDDKGDNAQFFFKLKQKIVLPGTPITYVGPKEIVKDGKPEQNYEFSINIDGKRINFVDQQHRKDGSYSRIKYMEFVPDFYSFPCIQEYRHMHFATLDDESVQVPAVQNFALKTEICKVLAWDNANNRILNWEQVQDESKLQSEEYKLFNPAPFGFRLTQYQPPLSRPPSMLKRRSNARALPTLPKSDSDDSEDDVMVVENDTGEGKDTKQETPYTVHRSVPQEAATPEVESRSKRAAEHDLDELLQREKERAEKQKAAKIKQDQAHAILTDLKRQLEEKLAQKREFTEQLRAIEKKVETLDNEVKALQSKISTQQTDKQASNMYCIISSFRNI